MPDLDQPFLGISRGQRWLVPFPEEKLCEPHQPGWTPPCGGAFVTILCGEAVLSFPGDFYTPTAMVVATGVMRPPLSWYHPGGNAAAPGGSGSNPLSRATRFQYGWTLIRGSRLPLTGRRDGRIRGFILRDRAPLWMAATLRLLRVLRQPGNGDGKGTSMWQSP